MTTTNNRDINNLLLSGQDPGAMIDFGRKQAGSVSESVPSGSSYSKFNEALMQMMKQYQTLGTGSILGAELNARDLQANRISAQATPGMSPSLQNQVRTAQAEALDPTIQGAQQSRQTFTEQIKSLGDTLSQVKGIGQWMQETERNTQLDAQNLIFKLPDVVKNLDDKAKRDLEKKAGLQSGIIDLIPATEKETWEQITLQDGSLAQKSSKTGEIKVLISSKDISSGSEEQFGTGNPLFEAFTLAGDLERNPKTYEITGAIQGRFKGLIGGESGALKAQFDQLVDKLALAARGQIKGQGAVSDYEANMLKSAQTSLQRTSDDASVKKELRKVKGILGLQGGQTIPAILTKDGESSPPINLTREGFNEAVKDGFTVEFQ